MTEPRPLSRKAELGLTDFQYFIEGILGIPLWSRQRRWADAVQEVVDSDTFFELQYLAPPSYGKSTRIIIPLPLWLLARDPRDRIGLLGNTDPYAEQISRACMTHIEQNDFLDKEYGLRPGIKWSASEWHIQRPNVTEKQASMIALGIGADIQSQRFDWLISDDRYTRANSATEDKRRKLSSYWETDAMSRVDKTQRPFGKGKVISFGHRVHANDGYEANLGKPDCKYYADQAILDDVAKTILMPESGHTYEAFAAHRGRDPEGFELTHQQRSAASGIYVTRSVMERCRKRDMRFAQSMNSELRGEFLTTWMNLDPAFSQNRWSSHAVFEAWGKTMTGHNRLIWALRDKVTPELLMNLCEMKFRLFMPDHFFIEGNQGQILLIPYLRRTFPDHASKFKAVYTTHNGKGSSNDLEQQINKMLEMYQTEPPIFEIPYATPLEQAFANTMTEEYCGYPMFGRRDTLMSQFIGLKGMGMLKAEERTARTDVQGGVMGAVAAHYQKRFRRGRIIGR